MTEVEKLKAYYKDRGIEYAHVSWEPGAATLNEEERAGFLSRVYADVDMQLANTVTIPVSQLQDICESLEALRKMSEATMDEWLNMYPEEVMLRRSIGNAIGMSDSFARQWLPQKKKV